MKISWTLDLEDGPVDPDDLLGKISLEHNGLIITDEITYLDSWFKGIVQGYQQLLTGQERVEVDLIDEPYLLLFEMQADGVQISYHSSYIESVSLPDFYQALTDAITELVTTVEADAINRDFTMIQPLMEFIGR